MILQGISWKTYQSLSHDLGEQQVRLTFDNGDLEIHKPQLQNEVWKCHLRSMLWALSEERQIETDGYGSSTMQHAELKKAIKPDECLYLGTYKVEPGDGPIDLMVHRIPDLVIDMNIVKRDIKRLPILLALNIPEIWQFDGKQLLIFRSGSPEQLAPRRKSELFPFLRMKEFEAFLLRMEDESELAVKKEFRVWLRSL